MPAATIDVAIVQVPKPFPELNRFFYAAVGGQWVWYSRLSWTYAQWMEYLDRPQLETWMISSGGLPAGYVELEKQADDSVQIAYVGIVAQLTGRGIGGHLLTFAIDRCWQWGANRVWVHTCNLDDPRALPNYQARGLKIYKVETKPEELPDAPLGPW
ncbi:MAG: GNAT family N-acetyltransferase [Pirellulales bacterium]|nr:GNAT family N-acetyltransferase [Pirellulales bacterium]